jgi:hypothetical protein
MAKFIDADTVGNPDSQDFDPNAIEKFKTLDDDLKTLDERQKELESKVRNASKAVEIVQSKYKDQPLPLGLQEGGSLRGTISDPNFYYDDINKNKLELEDIERKKQALLNPPKPSEVSAGARPAIFDRAGSLALKGITQAQEEQKVDAENEYKDPEIDFEIPELETQEKEQEYPDSMKRILGGYEKEAKAASDLGQFQAQQLEGFGREAERIAGEKQKLYSEADNATKNYITQKQADFDAYAKMAPQDFWADKSSGQKVTAALLLGIGALGGAMAKGPNQAQVRLDKIIEDDIARQQRQREFAREGMKFKDTLFDLNYKRIGDQQLALDATRLDAQQKVLTQIETMKAKLADPIARANLDKVSGQLMLNYEQAKAKHAVEMKEYLLEQAYKQADFKMKLADQSRKESEELRQQEELEMKRETAAGEKRKRFVPEFEQFALTAEDATYLKENGANTYQATKNLNRLMQLSQMTGRSVIPELKAEAEVIKAFITGDVKQQIVGTGAISDSDWALIDRAIADPSKFMSLDSSVKKRLQTAIDIVQSKFKARARGAGIDIDLIDRKKAAAEARMKSGSDTNRQPQGELDRDPSSEFPMDVTQNPERERQVEIAAGQMKRLGYLQVKDKKGKLVKEFAADKDWLRDAYDFSRRQKMNFVDLLKAVGAESRFRADAKNPSSSATGLIQFTDDTVKSFGIKGLTKASQVAKLSGRDQLKLMEIYFNKAFKEQRKKNPNFRPTFHDIYTAIAGPANVGKSKKKVVFKKGDEGYDKNENWDVNKDDKITIGEKSEWARKQAGFDF